MFDRSPIYYKLFCIKLKLKIYSDSLLFENKGNNDFNQFTNQFEKQRRVCRLIVSVEVTSEFKSSVIVLLAELRTAVNCRTIG